MLTPEETPAWARRHVDAWNSHDLDRIMTLYTEEVEVHSPLAANLTGSGVVRGAPAVRAYFAAALVRYKDLRFKLLDALLCLDSVALYYVSVEGLLVAEVLYLDENNRVSKALAHYAV